MQIVIKEVQCISIIIEINMQSNEIKPNQTKSGAVSHFRAKFKNLKAGSGQCKSCRFF